jgi:ABC-2 type transport system permease protein
VNRALLELLALDFRGRLVRRLRLLRQPRYLVASLVGAAYFLFFVIPRFGGVWTGRARGAGSPRGFPGLGGDAAQAGYQTVAPAMPLVLGLALAWGATMIWLFATSKPALRLSEAELHLLLPAPLTRRAIFSYALLKQQIGVLAGALIVTLLRGTGPPGQRLLRFFASWTLLTLVDLHLKGVSLWKARLAELPKARAGLRIAAACTVAALFWGSLVWSLWRIAASAGGAHPDWDLAKLQAILRGAVAGLPGTLLSPFVWLARPLTGFFFSASGAPGAGQGLAWSALFALVVLAAHYEWVLRSRGRFEEASLAAARRRLEQQAARRDRRRLPSSRARRREPFALSPQGRPEIAIYWKNLLLRGRASLAGRALALAAVCAGVGTVNLALGAPPGIASLAAGIGVALMLFAPPFAGIVLRNDLRADLRQVETVRTWPLTGRQLVGAELLAPATSALFVVGAGLGLLLAGAVPAWALANGRSVQPLFGNPGMAGGTSTSAVVIVLAASWVPLALAVALLSITVQNLAALAFPGWMDLRFERRRAAAVTGLRLLVVGGHILALALGLLPSLLLLGTAVLVQRLLGIGFHLAEAPAAALLAAAPLLAEVWLLVRAGGRRWDRLDPSVELFEAPE